jgi:metal-dependent hydrolase (beta-lactamase superfamily II)
VLSHLHWDHTHGMPFFRSGTLPGSRVNVYLPEQGAEPEELLARAISAGTVLIQQGDQGDAYYAIAAGELDVRQDGHFLRRCGRGEGVG